MAVRLHGSESVTRAVKELDHQITRLFVEASAAKLTLEQWRQQRAEAEAALEGLISAIRHEFRLPDFPIRLRLDPSFAAAAEELGAQTASS